MSKKEDWKKMLGISEYPWSTDEEDEEEPGLTLSQFPVQRERLNGTSDPMLPGPSASTAANASLPTGTAAAQKARDKKDRDSFWAALNGVNRFAAMASSASRHRSSPSSLPRSATVSGSGLARNANERRTLERSATGSVLTPNGSGSGLPRSGPSSGLSRSVPNYSVPRRMIAHGITKTRPVLSSTRSAPVPPLSCGVIFPDPRGGRTAVSIAPLPSTSSDRYVNLQNILETSQLVKSTAANLKSISRALLKAKRSRRSHSGQAGTPRAADDRPRQHRAPGGSFTAPPASKPIRVFPSDSESSLDETQELADSGSPDPVNQDPPREHPSTSSAPAMVLEEEIVEIHVEPAAETSTESVGAAATAVDVDVTATDGAGDGGTAQTQDSTNFNETNAELLQPRGVKRKREADDDDDCATVKEFNQSLLKLLECPVCLESMAPPLAQCRRGHLVCGKCRARLTTCPVCRAGFSGVRNRAMEGVAEMVRYPCRHGCSRELHLRRRAAHEASCPARRYRCPAACGARPIRRCDLPAHAQNKHLSILKLGRKHELSLPLNADRRSSYLVLVYGEVFHLRVEVDMRTSGLVLLVTYLGPLSEASKYTYQVVVAGQYKGRHMVYSRETHSDLEDPGVSAAHDCFHLTVDQALNYLRVKNRPAQNNHALNITVEILQNEPLTGSDKL